jgi:hypothetical protein
MVREGETESVNGPLAERKKTLVPKHRQFFGVSTVTRFVRVGQPDEMEHKRIDDFVWQFIFFVDQNSDEERVGT